MPSIEQSRESEIGKGKSKPLQSYSEKTKLEPWHLKAECDYTIASCTLSELESDNLTKAFNLRSGERDAKAHKHLTNTYGDEFPAKLTHIPLVKSMLDALKGILREMPFNKQVATADSHTYNEIQKRKIKELTADIQKKVQASAQQNMQQGQMQAGAPQTGQPTPPPVDPAGEAEMNKLLRYYELNWKDKLEISASHMLNYLRQKTRFDEKAEEIFEFLVTSGKCFYRVKVEQLGVAPLFEVVDSREFFYKKNRGTKYVKDHDRGRRRRMMPITEVINRWGHTLKQEDLNKLLDRLPAASSNQELYDTRLIEHGASDAGSNYFIEVNECEWKSNNKIATDAKSGFELSESDEQLLIANGREKDIKYKFRLDLYQCVRIGNDIYTDMGMVKYTKRSTERPHYCELTFNGVINEDGNGNPYSLVLATEALQDKYDYMFFHWENLVALSGVKAIMWDFANIPIWMGADPFERMKKWLYYLKQGLAVADTSDDNGGGGNQGKFAQAGEVDLSLNQSISVIIEMIRFIEETAARILGIPRQMIGQITEYDGKATAEMARASGTLTTKHIFMLHSDLMKQACEDLLNASRVSYKNGFQGAYILGNGQRTFFTIDADKFSLADMGVFVSDSNIEMQQIQEYKSLAVEFVKGQMVDAETALDVVTIRSVAEMKNAVREGIQRQKENNITQLQDQLKQAMTEVQKLQKELETVKQQTQQLEGQKVAIMKQDADTRAEIADSTVEYNKGKLELDKERVDLEGLQIRYSNQALEVKNK